MKKNNVSPREIPYNQEDLQSHRGVAAVIKNKQGKVLVQDHIKYGFWTIPIGKVKQDETVAEGLKTEMKEELDIEVGEFKVLGIFPSTYMRKGKEVTVIQYLIEVLTYNGKIINNEPQKHRCLKWMDLQELKTCKATSDAVKNYLSIF